MNDNYRAFLSDLADVLEKHNASLEIREVDCGFGTKIDGLDLDQHYDKGRGFLFTSMAFPHPLEADDIRRALEG